MTVKVVLFDHPSDVRMRTQIWLHDIERWYVEGGVYKFISENSAYSYPTRNVLSVEVTK
jgi:hypothetical protein